MRPSIRSPRTGPRGTATTLTDSAGAHHRQGHHGPSLLGGGRPVPARPLPRGRDALDRFRDRAGGAASPSATSAPSSGWIDDDDDPDLKTLGGAKGANSFINRILTVDSDLEYGLQDERYWMPSRQVLSGTLQIPIISDIVIPFEAITTFWDYDINSGAPVIFDTPPPDSGAKRTMDRESDSPAAVVRSGTWAGGRYEVHRPPVDTLKAYAAGATR